MADFQYVAYDSDKKLVKGVQKASTSDMARTMLTARGYNVLSVKSQSSFLPGLKSMGSVNKVPADTIVMFVRQLALLLDSGTPMVGALELLMKQTTSRRLHGVLSDMIDDLRKGNHLSQSMAKHPSVFNKMFVQSVVVGEQSGNLEAVLREMADHLEREEKEMKELKAALMYPAILVFVSIVVVAILGIFVLPVFADLYSDLGLTLPLITRMLFNFADWFGVYGIYVLLGFLLAVVGAYVWSRTPRGKYRVDGTLLRMPVIGRIILLGELSRACRSMSILHRTGLPVTETMTLIMEASKNAIIQQALTDVHQEVLRGSGIGDSMAKHEAFLPMMVQMVQVGESTGTLDVTLTATADSYEAELANRMRAMIALIQPVFTVVLAVVVGIIAVAMISAMYSMYDQFGAAGL